VEEVQVALGVDALEVADALAERLKPCLNYFVFFYRVLECFFYFLVKFTVLLF